MSINAGDSLCPTPTPTDIELNTDHARFYCSTRAVIKQGDQYLVMQVTKSDGSVSSFHYPTFGGED